MSTAYEYEVPLPGFFIQEELDARAWTQRDLAFILGIEETALNKIIKGKTGISIEMSKALGDAFGVDPDFFANLQKAYDLAHAPAADPAIARRASLQSDYPVREMIRRGWLVNTNVELLEVQLNRFLKCENDNVRQIRHAARKTNYGEDPTAHQLAWLYRVIQIAEQMKPSTYNERALSESKAKLKRLMQEAWGVQQVPKILADCGVRFILVEGLPKEKIDGVCIWLDPNSPVIAMSLRHDRIDNFWFVLWHEITHVLNRDGRNESAWIVDVELEKSQSDEAKRKIGKQELKANDAAGDACSANQKLFTALAGRTFYSERDILALADSYRIHPGILVGQIQNKTGKWDFLRRYLVRVREHLMPTATVDGWGHVVPISL
jgi:HTH-type transcriptional regulator/antitoxin HigA